MYGVSDPDILFKSGRGFITQIEKGQGGIGK